MFVLPRNVYKVKFKKRCSKRTADDDQELKNIRAEIQGQEVDTDNWSISGYSSSSLGGIPVINNTINITFNCMTNLASVLPNEINRDASNPENIGKEVPYSVQKTYDNDESSSAKILVISDHAQTNNQKPVSDENNCTKIAVGYMSVDIDDLNKCFKQEN
ncbi:hypothetical protein CHS0354_007059 [Potamilus streckersoni]|uniref:Uncharacterized protein n=1 Tax=Potamilus streckersoni TaxID=2493646 RepID=A0AAE0SBR7_9BIVA|nr:hypothetical protein CHS0354_007059 [Potamilus streckersoni]